MTPLGWLGRKTSTQTRRHSSCSFDHVSVSFLWNKENKLIFYRVKKNLIYFSCLQSIFLFPVFLCSLIIPFMEDSIIFIKSIFSFLWFLSLICVICFRDFRVYHQGSRVLYQSHAWNKIFISFFLFQIIYWYVITGPELWRLQSNEDYTLREDLPWGRSWLRKESCQPCGV